ncbi:MAG: transposase, partial [Candidatus Sabulitectum sp.]|nr:transposase [Candidatus Sabulitectum sp.]
MHICLERIEFRCTPKHGSWLNMAEIELSVLSRQCLNRRIPDQETFKKEVAAWQEKRNSIAGPMNWRFTTKDARNDNSDRRKLRGICRRPLSMTP